MMLTRALMFFCEFEDSGSAVSLGRPDVFTGQDFGRLTDAWGDDTCHVEKPSFGTRRLDA